MHPLVLLVSIASRKDRTWWLSTYKKKRRNFYLFFFMLSHYRLVHICHRKFSVAYRSTSILYKFVVRRKMTCQITSAVSFVHLIYQAERREKQSSVCVVVVIRLKLDFLSIEYYTRPYRRISLYYFKFVYWKLLFLSTFDLKS
jgi:hypothetical protein